MENEFVRLFSDGEKRSAKNTKTRLLIIWISILVIYVALVLTLMMVNLYQVNVHRDRSMKVAAMTVSIIASILVAVYSVYFLALKFRLTRKYVKMLKDIDTGLKDEANVELIKFDPKIVEKDGVFFYTMLVNARPLKREDITERSILIEHTIKQPDLYKGQRMKVITHANILIEYKLIGEKVLPPENAAESDAGIFDEETE